MIKKKNNTYKLIKKNIAKLALIHQTTEISPNRLVSLFLRNLPPDEIPIHKKTKEGYWDWKLADNTAYKYFKKELAVYLSRRSSAKGGLGFVVNRSVKFLSLAFLIVDIPIRCYILSPANVAARDEFTLILKGNS